MQPSYIVFKTYSSRGPKGEHRIVRCDAPHHQFTAIGYLPTKREAMLTARLLAGRAGRVAFTTDPTTYPW